MLLRSFFSIILFLPFFVNAQVQENWFITQTEAMVYAAKHETQILMVFAGSDWCRPCIQLKKDVLLDPTFASNLSENISILYLDFPVRKKNKLSTEMTAQNEALAELYNKAGSFPKIILMDKSMVKIKDIPYQGEDVVAFSKLLND